MLLTPLRSFKKRLLASFRQPTCRRNPEQRLAVPAQVERLEGRVMLSTLGTGEVQTVVDLPTEPPNHPEGVAVAADGTVYVGNRVETTNEDGDPVKTSEIFRFDPEDGTVAEFATLSDVNPSASGLLGLATYQGDVYAALASLDSDTRGVYRISRGGAPDGPKIERFAGSQFMAFPNAITFDDAGSMYVTDSFGPDLESGAVWRFSADDPDELGELWVQDELLSPSSNDPFGFPLPGANGVAFFPNPDPHLNVANTEKGLVAKVPINEDGSAGAVEVVADTGPFGSLGTVDGIQVDVNGDIHGVIPGAAVLGTSPLARVDVQTGTVTATVTNLEEAAKFDIGLSLAFGRLPDDQTTVYATNGDLGETPPTGPGEPGPGLIQVGVGIKGFELSGGDDGTTSADGSTLVLDTAASDEGSHDDGSNSLIAVTTWEPSDSGSAATGPTQTAIDDGSPLGGSDLFGDLAEPTDSNAIAVDNLFSDLDGGLLDDLFPAGLSG